MAAGRECYFQKVKWKRFFAFSFLFPKIDREFTVRLMVHRWLDDNLLKFVNESRERWHMM